MAVNPPGPTASVIPGMGGSLPPAGGATVATHRIVPVRATVAPAATQPGLAPAGRLVPRRAAGKGPGRTASEMAAPERTASGRTQLAGVPAAPGVNMTEILAPAVAASRRAAAGMIQAGPRPATARMA